MRGDQALGNIDHFIGGHILFRTKRTYLLNKGEKTPFRKKGILAKLLTFCIPTSLSQLIIKTAEILTQKERKICKNTQKILLDGCYLLFEEYLPENTSF